MMIPKKYLKTIKSIENITGFDVVRKDEIKDDKTASDVLMNHISWLRMWAEESSQRAEKVLMGVDLYDVD